VDEFVYDPKNEDGYSGRDEQEQTGNDAVAKAAH
jgi:hypothetical protein